MVRILNRYGWLLLLGAGLQGVFAFSLLGPFPASSGAPDGYQQPEIGYQIGGDIGAPKNLGEEFRWNTKTLYYSFDQTFLDYFGSNGVAAIEQAIAICNGLSNVSAYSTDLSEWPMEAQRINYRAQALHLFDLKSATLYLLAEQLGLAPPDRWTWCLRTRDCPQCPICTYSVIKRNFDPVTWEPTSYVNGTLYSYLIIEFCSGPPPLADAYEFPVDPLATTYSAVASFGMGYGSFYTGLTRDDVAGLRYLYRPNNMNVEQVEPGSVLILTNRAANPVLLFPSNLNEFAEVALTNDAVGLTALYPDLIVASTTNFFENVVVTNFYAYYTNFPWSPASTPASLVIVTNLSTNIVTRYQHAFANVVTNRYFTNGCYTAVETRVEPAPWGPPGNLVTNVSTRTVCSANMVMGEYWIVPTNLNLCDVGYSIISTQLVQLLTNVVTILEATNAPGVTNLPGTTNAQQYIRSEIHYFTNYIYVAYPVVCQEDSVALRQGMDKISFVRRDYDSLIGQFFYPITNKYYLLSVTNSMIVTQWLQRVVTQPDILFHATDTEDIASAGLRSIDYNSSNVLAGLAGPGTIRPPLTFTYNKVGPVLINFYDPFYVFSGLSESTATTNFIWGTFDGSTNDPIVYPSGASIAALENMVLFGVATATLPNGQLRVPYNAQLQAYGGQPPYAWSLATGSAGLPYGLGLSTNGVIAGTPSMAGTFDFTVRVTEAGARTADRPLTIIISP